MSVTIEYKGIEFEFDEIPSSDELEARYEEYQRNGGNTDEGTNGAAIDYDYGRTAPLSAGQRRMWYLYRMDPESAAHHVPQAVRLTGELDREALRSVWAEIVGRHEILRSRFRERDGEPIQEIQEPPETIDWDIRDLSDHGDPEARAAELVERQTARPFDLSEEPPVRLTLFRLSATDHVLLVLYHHIAVDEWSTGIVTQELAELYQARCEGREPELPAPPSQYAEYALWQRDWLGSEAFDEGRAFWRDYLEGANRSIDWPIGREPSGQEHPAGYVSFEWSAATSEKFRQLTQGREATEFVASFALFAGFLSRYTGQRDVTIGTPATLRDRAEWQRLVGFMLNTVPLRVETLPGLSFERWLEQVESNWTTVREHKNVPLDEIVKAAGAKRGGAGTPLYDVLFTYVPREWGETAVGDVTIEPFNPGGDLSVLAETPETTRALTAAVSGSGDRVHGSFRYDAARFDRTDIERLVEAFEQFVEACLEAPETAMAGHQLVEAERRRNTIEQWAEGPTITVPDEPIHRAIEEQVEAHPDRVALSFEGGEWTYGELNRRANRLADHLLERGVELDEPVGVAIERSPELVAALLGVMKAGGAYVALEPSLPGERLAYMAADAGIERVVVTRETAGVVSGDAERIVVDEIIDRSDAPGDPEVEIEGRNLAYILYTSGTTGQPKGVAVQHVGLRDHVQTVARRLEMGDGKRVLQKSPVGFDVSVSEVFGPLAHGGTLVVGAPEVESRPGALLETLAEHEVTTTRMVPTTLGLLVEEMGPDETFPADQIVLGGETVSAELIERLRASFDGRVSNWYGLTETSVSVTGKKIGEPGDASRISIGHPLPNHVLRLLDERLETVTDAGRRGELYIEGIGLARGYHDASKETAERFVPSIGGEPKGARMYRTGDLAQWSPNGELRYAGRKDQQLQLRGIRVELGEIEARLEEAPGVSQAAVRAVDEQSGRADSLIGYLVPEGEADLEISEVRAQLGEHLQEAVIPSRYVELDEMPRTSSGKIDRSALPEPDEADGFRDREKTPPRSASEQTVAAIWRDVLDLEEVGVHENFFEIGGDSLASIEITSRLNEQGIALRAMDLVETQTIAEIGALIDELDDERSVHAEQGKLEGSVEPRPLQRWLLERSDYAQWCHAIMWRPPMPLDEEILERVAEHLVEYHDSLRLRVERDDSGERQLAHAPSVEGVSVECIALDEEDPKGQLVDTFDAMIAEIDPEQPPALRFVYIDEGDEAPGRVLMAAHYLVTDHLSNTILRNDFNLACRQWVDSGQIAFPEKSTSFQYWTDELARLAETDEMRRDLDFWTGENFQTSRGTLPVEADEPDPDNSLRTMQVHVGRSPEVTQQELVGELGEAYGVRLEEILLTALGGALTDWHGESSTVVGFRTHGRYEDLVDEPVDLSRSVGWFASLHPVVLETPAGDGPEDAVVNVKEHLRSVPHHGLSYGLLRHVSEDRQIREQMAQVPSPPIIFNYLGDLEQSDEPAYQRTADIWERVGQEHAIQHRGRITQIEVYAVVEDDELQFIWEFSSSLHSQSRIETLQNSVNTKLRELYDHARELESGTFTPSDFDEPAVDEERLEQIGEMLE